jgi:hypothetical protein
VFSAKAYCPLFGGWSLLMYLVFFLPGYLLGTDERYTPTIAKVRFISLTLNLLPVIVVYNLLEDCLLHTR